MVTISEMRRKNKLAGHYFFEKGNPPIIFKKGNYVVTKGFGDSFPVYKYDPKNGQINYVASFETKQQAVTYAKGIK